MNLIADAVRILGGMCIGVMSTLLWVEYAELTAPPTVLMDAYQGTVLELSHCKQEREWLLDELRAVVEVGEMHDDIERMVGERQLDFCFQWIPYAVERAALALEAIERTVAVEQNYE